jgi:putative tryptophan/tyrosine transport system substrate-binding protein
MAMRRRDFIAGLGSATAWPLTASGQQTNKLKRVVVAMTGPENDPSEQRSLKLFRDGLQKLGWSEGQNILIEVIWKGVNPATAKLYVSDISANPPNAVVTTNLPGFLAMREGASSVPLVFVNLPDPVLMGLVSTLTNSGGNFTGFTAYEFSIAGKWLQVLKEVAPETTRVAMTFGNLTSVVGERFYRSLEAAAGPLGIETTAIRINAIADIQSGIDAFVHKPNGGLLAAAEVGSIVNRSTIIELASRYRIPAVYPHRRFVDEGGLAFYGLDFPTSLYRGAASYVDRILRGTKPSDLPIQAPTQFQLVINRRAAKTIGLEIPSTLLARADEVIE